MTIFLENETEIDLGIDYRTIADKVVNEALDYVGCPYECEVNILLTDNKGIHELNRTTRGIDAPTDVLSFPAFDFESPADFSVSEDKEADYFNSDSGELMLGDIMISLDKVLEQSKEYGHSITREFAFLIAHSMLHLCGYDHMDEDERTVMELKQNEILNNIGYTRDN